MVAGADADGDADWGGAGSLVIGLLSSQFGSSLLIWIGYHMRGVVASVKRVCNHFLLFPERGDLPQ